MIELPTPKTKWYVTEYPEECSFAITDGNEILVTIIGGNTIGDQCDLASRIAKLPDLERERDETREELAILRSNKMSDPLLEATFKHLIRERDEAREDLEEEKRFHHRTHSELIQTQCKLMDFTQAIISTLEENRHLADGDDCTLAKLKSVVPDWK